MSVRGTRLTPSTGFAGTSRSRWYPWQHFLSAQVTGASTVLVGGSPAGTTPVTTGTALGKGSNTWPMTGLFITTADAVSIYIPTMDDIDLVNPIYFDWYFYMKTGMSAADTITIAGLYLYENPVGGTGAADDFGVDRGSATPGSGSLVIAAADVVQIKKATGMYIAGNTFTDNYGAFVLRGTFTLTTASAAEFSLIGMKMRYTPR